MSSVDFRNTKSNLTDPHFRAQLNRLLHPAGRIADIESDDDDDPLNGWFPTLQPSARSHRPEQRKHVSARPKAPEMGRSFSNICLLKGLRRVSYVFSFASFFMFCTLSSCIVSSIVIYQRTPNITR
jgi:hypothetical protein